MIQTFGINGRKRPMWTCKRLPLKPVSFLIRLGTEGLVRVPHYVYVIRLIAIPLVQRLRFEELEDEGSDLSDGYSDTEERRCIYDYYYLQF